MGEINVKAGIEVCECTVDARIGTEAVSCPGLLLYHLDPCAEKVSSMAQGVVILELVRERIPTSDRNADDEEGDNEPPPECLIGAALR